MRTAVKHKLWVYAAFAVGWTALGIFYFSQGLTQKLIMRDQTPWLHLLLMWLVGIYIFAFLSLVVLWLGRRFPIRRENWPRRTALHLLFSVCFSLLDLIIAAALFTWLRLMPSIFKDFSSTLGFLLVIDFHSSIIGYWTILGVQAGLRYYRAYQEGKRQALRLELQASELKTQLAQARLRALKAQLQPHFLFNTLNAIAVLVRQQKTQLAEEMVAGLSDLLRCVLEDVDAQEVPLRRELEYLKIYLSIQQVRFQDRMKVVISADPDTVDAAVPQMALQPIVENAIVHGMGRRSRAGLIEIHASRLDGDLVIQVEDDGPGFADPLLASETGIGLMNTQERLQQLYGARGQLTAGNREMGGARVTLMIPYHLISGVSGAEIMEVHTVDNAAS